MLVAMMAEPTVSSRRPSKEILAAILLGIVGLAFSWFRWEVSLFFNVDFTFGSVFVFLAFLFCGAWPGLLAAAIAYAGSVVVYHHPWAFVIFMGQAAVIASGGRARTWHLAALVTAYWAVVGAPLGCALYHFAMGVPTQSALVLMSKSLLNEVLNALIATIVFLGAMPFRRHAEQLPSFRSLVFTLLLALALTPALLLMATHIRATLREERRELAQFVNHASTTARNLLAGWLREHQQPVDALASLVGDPARTPSAKMQQLVEAVKKLSPQFLGMGVIDADGVTAAYSPLRDETGRPNVGVDVSMTPYAQILRERLGPYVPGLLVAHVGRPRPIQLLLSPIVVKGQFCGYCSAIVDPSSLRTVIGSETGNDSLEITLLDPDDHVVVSTRQDLPMMAAFPRPEGGTVVEQSYGVRQWIPAPVEGHTPVQGWWSSYLFKVTPPTEAVPWKIVTEASVAPIVQEMNQTTLEHFLLMALIAVVSVVIAHFASRALVRPIRIFDETTSALPQRIINGDAALTWPGSRIAELESLAATFKTMAEALQGAFAELRTLNETLEQRVHERAREIQEREENFRILFDQAADNILLLEMVPGTVPHIRDLNAAALALLGYAREDLVGKPISIIDPDPQLADKIEERHRPFTSEETAHFEVRHRCRDGSVRTLQCAATAVHIRGEKLILSTERDVTDLRLAEKEQERLRDQLREAQKREAIGTLAGGIAHDFNNILTPIMAHAEFVLMRLPAEDPAREDITQILVSAERAANLVRQILAVSRQRKAGELVPVALEPLIKETLKFLRATIPANVEIQSRFDPGCPAVLGDVAQLQQVLINLCANARDAMLEGGGILSIELSVAPWEDSGEPWGIRLRVHDTGPGIPADLIPRIFDPYFTTKPEGKGTGLGLAVSHGIVTALGGSIRVRSKVGEGATFEVFLPVAKEARPQPVARSPDLVPGEGRHVLVVDDEEVIRIVLGRLLPTLGYRVTACASAAEALATLAATPESFDAVLTDHTMPGTLGLDLARELLRMRPGLPVLIGTGFAAGVNEETIREMGLSGFVAKPYNLQRLGEILGQALARKHECPDDPASPDPEHLDHSDA